MVLCLSIIKIYKNWQLKCLKVFRGLSAEILNELFQFREQIPYELRQMLQFEIPWVHSVFSGTESLKFLRPNKCNKTMETYILSLQTMQKIYS